MESGIAQTAPAASNLAAGNPTGDPGDADDLWICAVFVNGCPGGARAPTARALGRDVPKCATSRSTRLAAVATEVVGRINAGTRLTASVIYGDYWLLAGDGHARRQSVTHLSVVTCEVLSRLARVAFEGIHPPPPVGAADQPDQPDTGRKLELGECTDGVAICPRELDRRM